MHFFPKTIKSIILYCVEYDHFPAFVIAMRHTCNTWAGNLIGSGSETMRPVSDHNKSSDFRFTSCQVFHACDDLLCLNVLHWHLIVFPFLVYLGCVFPPCCARSTLPKGKNFQYLLVFPHVRLDRLVFDQNFYLPCLIPLPVWLNSYVLTCFWLNLLLMLCRSPLPVCAMIYLQPPVLSVSSCQCLLTCSIFISFTCV